MVPGSNHFVKSVPLDKRIVKFYIWNLFIFDMKLVSKANVFVFLIRDLVVLTN